MITKPVAEAFRALYPDELRRRYAAGDREFSRINLLRTELEYIAARRSPPPEASTCSSERYNPLWCDFNNPVEREFEWDLYGHFIPTEFDDLLPPRDLSTAGLAEIKLDGSYLYPVNFERANLTGASLRNAILLDIDLRHADLSYADLRGATVVGDLTGAKLYMARLERASLAGCELLGADLRRAKLRRTSLQGATLRNANLAKAKLTETSLIRADLRGVDFEDVTLGAAYVGGATLDDDQIGDFLNSLRITVAGGGHAGAE